MIKKMIPAYRPKCPASQTTSTEGGIAIDGVCVEITDDDLAQFEGKTRHLP